MIETRAPNSGANFLINPHIKVSHPNNFSWIPIQPKAQSISNESGLQHSLAFSLSETVVESPSNSEAVSWSTMKRKYIQLCYEWFYLNSLWQLYEVPFVIAFYFPFDALLIPISKYKWNMKKVVFYCKFKNKNTDRIYKQWLVGFIVIKMSVIFIWFNDLFELFQLKFITTFYYY